MPYAFMYGIFTDILVTGAQHSCRVNSKVCLNASASQLCAKTMQTFMRMQSTQLCHRNECKLVKDVTAAS